MLEIAGFTADDPRFAACFAIRVAVFVEEQQVTLAEEQDELDHAATHFLATLNGRPAATIRLLMFGSTAKITRVAVMGFARGTGLGARLMRHVEAASGAVEFVLDAQIQAMGFYKSLGYQPEGDIFMEAGIPHTKMRKSAPNPA